MKHSRFGSVSRFAFLAGPRHRRGSTDDPDRLEDYVLEMLLVDSVAMEDPARYVIAERLIQRRIPRTVYPLVIDRFDSLSDDTSDTAAILATWLPKAALKDSRWKSKMIRWLVVVAAGGARVTMDQLLEISHLASAIGAAPQCQRLFRNAFDFDPYDQSRSGSPAPR